MNTFGAYKGRCVGRVLNVLNQYVPLTIVENLCVGEKTVTQGKSVFATFTWEDTTDFPVFHFMNETYNGIQAQRINDVKSQTEITDLAKVYKDKIKELQSELFGLHLYMEMSESPSKEVLEQKIKKAMQTANEPIPYF